VRFETILLKGRPIGIEQQLEILLAWHALRGHVTVFLMSDYEIILYHTMEWRKRLVNKKGKSLPAHGAERQLMAPGGQLMAEKDSSWTRQASSYELCWGSVA
jgi:hypothetical protein